MTETIRETDTGQDSAAAVLGFVRDRRAVADRAEAELLRAAVSWVAMHSVDSIDQAATVWDRTYGDTGITVAGPGAPLVAEFSVAEFGAAVGLATEAAKAYLGEAVELRHRLPRTWSRVSSGELVAWKARRIARATILLSAEAADFVDRHVAPIAHRVRLSQLDRLVGEAIGRFMPEETERRRQQAADGRSFNIDTSQTSLEGTADVWGTLDAADALDLDAAVSAGAESLKALGSTEPLDVRRAQAVGALARRQLSLDLNAGTDTELDPHAATVEPSDRSDEKAKPRQVVLYVHLSEAAIRGEEAGGFGRCENTRSPITAEQIRSWCATPDAQVVVKPVLDLDEHHHVDAYEVPDRIVEQSVLVNHDLRLPLVHPQCPGLRQRPHPPPRPRRPHVQRQHRAPVPQAPSVEDPRRVDLHAHRGRHLSLDQPARLHLSPRPVRHPRRQPRPTPGTRSATRATSLTAPHPAKTPPAGAVAWPGASSRNTTTPDRVPGRGSLRGGTVLVEPAAGAADRDEVQDQAHHEQNCADRGEDRNARHESDDEQNQAENNHVKPPPGVGRRSCTTVCAGSNRPKGVYFSSPLPQPPEPGQRPRASIASWIESVRCADSTCRFSTIRPL